MKVCWDVVKAHVRISESAEEYEMMIDKGFMYYFRFILMHIIITNIGLWLFISSFKREFFEITFYVQQGIAVDLIVWQFLLYIVLFISCMLWYYPSKFLLRMKGITIEPLRKVTLMVLYQSAFFSTLGTLGVIVMIYYSI